MAGKRPTIRELTDRQKARLRAERKARAWRRRQERRAVGRKG